MCISPEETANTFPKAFLKLLVKHSWELHKVSASDSEWLQEVQTNLSMSIMSYSRDTALY